MREITKQEAIELLEQRKIKIEDVFEFIEYLDQVKENYWVGYRSFKI
jgi:hypothetical protein